MYIILHFGVLQAERKKSHREKAPPTTEMQSNLASERSKRSYVVLSDTMMHLVRTLRHYVALCPLPSYVSFTQSPLCLCLLLYVAQYGNMQRQAVSNLQMCKWWNEFALKSIQAMMQHHLKAKCKMYSSKNEHRSELERCNKAERPTTFKPRQ